MSCIEYIRCDICGLEINRNTRELLTEWRSIYVSPVTSGQATSTKYWDLCAECSEAYFDNARQFLMEKTNAEIAPQETPSTDVTEETPDQNSSAGPG